MRTAFARRSSAAPLATATTDHALRPVLAALRAGKSQDAARRFVGAALDRLIPTGRPLIDWLKTRMDKRTLGQLVESFAQYPCFVCRNGLEICDACRGKGRLRGLPCEQCVALGVCICKFCGGSGWVTINFVPQGLRSAVILRRIELIRALFDRFARHRRADKAALHGRDVLYWNRILAMLENALTGLRLSCGREPLSAQQRDRAIARCTRLGRRADQHLRYLLQQLSRHATRNTEKAELYRDVAENPAMNAQTEHPFLRRAIHAARRRTARTT